MTSEPAAVYHDIPFGDLCVGQVARTRFDVEETLRRLTAANLGTSWPSEKEDVPPWVYCTFLPTYEALGGRVEQGTVHVQHRVTVLAPVRLGETLEVEVEVLEAELLKKRVVVESRFGRSGQTVCRSAATYLWGYAR